MIRRVNRRDDDACIAQTPPIEETGAGGMPRRELSGRLAGRSLPGQVFVLAVWPFFELLFNALVGIVDTALAGWLEDQAMVATDAIGVAAYVGWFMGMMHMAVGVGAAALIARAIGAGHRGLANAGLGQALLIAVVWGAFIGGLVFALATPIGRLFGLGPEALMLSTTYLRIVALSAPGSAALFVGAACLRAAGDTRTPFLVMLVVNLTNTALSWTLVFGPAPFGGMGLPGIAVGTFVAWNLAGGIILVLLLRGRDPLRLYPHRLRPHWHTLRRIIRVAIPSALENSGMWVGNALVGAIVGLIAAREAIVGLMGAHIIAIRIESISFLPGVAMGIAAATLTGQYLGLGDPQRAKRAAILCWLFGAGLMSLMGLVFIAFPTQLAALLTREPELYTMAAAPIRICGFIQFFFASYLALSKALRGAGDTVSPMVITYASTFLLRLPGAYVVGYVLGYGLTGVWFALCAELAVRGLIYIAWFFRGKWMTVKV